MDDAGAGEVRSDGAVANRDVMHIWNAANGLSCYEGATLLPSRMMCNRDLVWVLSDYLNSRQLSRPAPHQHCWRTMWINSLRQHRRQGAERSAFAVEAIRVGVGLELAEVLDFKLNMACT